MTIATSQDIDQHVREQPIRDASDRLLRERYVAGTFGQGVADLPPLPTMPAHYHVLSEIERKVEGIRSELVEAGEQGLWDELWRFMEHLWERMAAESEEGSAA